MRACSGSPMGHALHSISQEPGSTALAVPCCTSTTSHRPRSSSVPSGVIDQVAFGCRGFEAAKRHLSEKGVPYQVNQVPNSARWQIFLRDPNNVEIELNFESKNETGE